MIHASCVCGATYESHRTGLTFGEVRRMMFVSHEDPTLWRQKRRRGVLGFWRELKIHSWEALHGACEEAEQASA